MKEGVSMGSGSAPPVPPAITPGLVSIVPAEVDLSSTEDVVIVGLGTSFQQGVTTIDFGADITVNSVTVIRTTVVAANITVDATAVTGPRDVTVTTGAEVVTLSGQFSVEAAELSLSPTGKPMKPLVPQTYNVLIGLEAKGGDALNDVFHILWEIDGQLLLTPNPLSLTTSTPYSASFVPANQFNVTVEDWTFLLPNGGGRAVLISPMEYTTPMGEPDIDMGLPIPTLSIPFAQPIPLEWVVVKGQQAQMGMFGSMLGTILATNAVTLAPVQAMTGNTSDGTSGAPDIAGLTQTAQQLAAEGPALAATGAGVDVVTALLGQALGMVSIPASQAGSIAAMTSTFMSVQAPWTVGSAVPVNQTLTFSQGNLGIMLKAYVILEALDPGNDPEA